jgi:hypothetical protein
MAEFNTFLDYEKNPPFGYLQLKPHWTSTSNPSLESDHLLQEHFAIQKVFREAFFIMWPIHPSIRPSVHPIIHPWMASYMEENPKLMHRCVFIWWYILKNYNYKLHFQNLFIYHILHVVIGTLATENLDVCTACDPWNSNIQLTMVKDWRWQIYPNLVQCLTLTLVDCHAQSL